MAFEFFRKRQKLVIIVMVVLMVSFLISFQGLDMLLPSRNPDKQPIGHVPGGDVLWGEVRRAQSDLEILREHLGLGFVRAEPSLLYLELLGMEKDAALGFVLLQREARDMGITVSDSEIDGFLAQLGLEGASLQSLMRRLEGRDSNLNLTDLRSTVRNWLLVQKAYEGAMALTPPSEPSLKHLYRDLHENIQLQYVRVPAEKFLDQVAQPSDQEIATQFKTFRDVLSAEDNFRDPAKSFPTADSFGFGYKQPDRVQIEYLVVNLEPLRRATEPTAEEILRYFEAHPNRFTKEVPLATQPTTTSPTQPAPTRTVRKTLREAEEQVVAEVTEELVQANVDAILRAAEAAVTRQASQGGTKGKPAYQQAADEMTLAPDSDAVRESLDREVPRAVIDRIAQMPLEKAIRELARGVGLQTIVYPWGRHGEYNIDPQIKVTLRAQGKLTLAAALDQITQQVFGPTTPATQPKTQPATKPTTQPVQIRWGMFTGLRTNSRRVLFPYAGEESLRMFPVTVARTELADRQALIKQDLLRSATVGQQLFGGEGVIDLAMDSVPFQTEKDKQGSGVRLGEDRRAFVRAQGFGEIAGIMVWRLTQAVPAYAPETIDSVPGLREQVIRDLKIKKAFEKARQAAQEIVASGKGLEEVAKARDLSLDKTEMFSRKREFSPQQRAMLQAQFSGRQPGLDIYLAKPVEFIPSDVSGISLPTRETREAFMEQAFALTPKDPESTDKAPSKPTVIAVPSDRAAVVAQRVDYRPPVVGEYEDQYRPRLASQMLANRQWLIRTQWFDWKNLTERRGFTYAKQE